MRRTSPGIASALALALALSACSGHSSLPSLAGNPQAASQSLASQTAASQSGVTHSTLSDKPIVSVPRMFGKLSFSDIGRHPSNAVIRVSLTLRYNHQNQLDELVAKLANSSGSHHRSLSPREFNSYYAPTSEQERSVLRALREAGFTIGSGLQIVRSSMRRRQRPPSKSFSLPKSTPYTRATRRSLHKRTIGDGSAEHRPLRARRFAQQSHRGPHGRRAKRRASSALRRSSRATRRGVPSYRSRGDQRRWTRAAISSTAALRPARSSPWINESTGRATTLR